MQVLDPNVVEGDERVNVLRPTRLSEFPGQEHVKPLLMISIEAAKRGVPYGHALFYGPPGLGKTTLANIIANELGGGFHVTSAPAIRRTEELANILTGTKEGDVVFIDEIHRLPMALEEVLYAAMEDGVIDVILGKGPGATAVRFTLPQITLVGATTRLGSLSEPLRDRFRAVHRLEPYSVEVLTQIVEQSARKLDVPMEPGAAAEIASRSRGTPRIANRLLLVAQEYAVVMRGGVIDMPCVAKIFSLMRLDEKGLDEQERRLLTCLARQPGPIGVGTMAALIDETVGTIEDVMEPHLMQHGLITRTPQGRIITDEGRAYVA